MALALSTPVDPKVTTVDERWDSVVVGAGPAGAVAARELARHGASVLLVDKAAFPRHKVCGCCVNGSALQTLSQIGLAKLTENLGAVRTDRLGLFARNQTLSLPIPNGVCVSRRLFDWALTREAVAAGVTFRPGMSASLIGTDDAWRFVRLTHSNSVETVATRLVIAANGLDGRMLSNEPALTPIVARHARIGAAVICDDVPDAYEPGQIYMACDTGGYVGLVRLEDNRLNIATAMDSNFIKRTGGPGRAAAKILDHVGLAPISQLIQRPWQGTPPLTRRLPFLGSHRLLVVGDAAGYVEPFTGEGMAWALASAEAVLPYSLNAITHWRTSIATQWTHRHRQAIGQRQRWCRCLRQLLRHPPLITAAMSVMRVAPIITRPIICAIMEQPLRGRKLLSPRQ